MNYRNFTEIEATDVVLIISYFTCLSLAILHVCHFSICDALCDLIPFVRYKKREKHTWGVLLLVNFVPFVGFKKR